MKLDPAPTAAGQARGEVDRFLHGAVDEETCQTLMLLMTELVTNAVLHVGAPLEVDVHSAAKESVRVEVRDPSPFPPHRRDARESTSGRGLNLVDALADRWGVELTSRGKSVWFELDL